MELDFWHDRWKNGQIGFHQADINTYLLKYWGKLNLVPGSQIFVPMAGKTKDILWLKDQGYQVLAVELSEQAILAFYQENHLAFRLEKTPDFTIYYSDNIVFYCGNFFDLQRDILQDINAVFDRAALIALPQSMRQEYQRKMQEILPSEVKIFLVTMEYPQQQMDGPPFSVSQNEVKNLFSTTYDMTHLETFDVLKENPHFADKGLTKMLEKVFLMQPSV